MKPEPHTIQEGLYVVIPRCRKRQSYYVPDNQRAHYVHSNEIWDCKTEILRALGRAIRLCLRTGL